MSEKQKQLEFKDKIIEGLELAFDRLIEYKKYKKTDLVISQGDKIVHIKPEDLDAYRESLKKKDQ